MVHIDATPGAFFVVVAIVIGVSAWVGYLLGRLRSVRGYPSWGTSSDPDESGVGRLVLGAALLFVGAVALALIFGGGPPQSIDGPAVLLLIITVSALGLGAMQVMAGYRTRYGQR